MADPFATHTKAANFNTNSSATAGEFLGIHYDCGGNGAFFMAQGIEILTSTFVPS
jgi:hypothetical protein